MKSILLTSLIALAPTTWATVTKSTFALFGTAGAQYAQASCKGLPQGPVVIKLVDVDGGGTTFEGNTKLGMAHLVVTANLKPDEYNLTMAIASEVTQPLTAATNGLDVNLRQGSGTDIYCELNVGTQL